MRKYVLASSRGRQLVLNLQEDELFDNIDAFMDEWGKPPAVVHLQTLVDGECITRNLFDKTFGKLMIEEILLSERIFHGRVV